MDEGKPHVYHSVIPPGTTIEVRPAAGEVVHITAPLDGKGLEVVELDQYEDETGRHERKSRTEVATGAFGVNLRHSDVIFSYSRSG